MFKLLVSRYRCTRNHLLVYFINCRKSTSTYSASISIVSYVSSAVVTVSVMSAWDCHVSLPGDQTHFAQISMIDVLLRFVVIDCQIDHVHPESIASSVAAKLQPSPDTTPRCCTRTGLTITTNLLS